jgi:alpha-ribazole phosphatase
VTRLDHFAADCNGTGNGIWRLPMVYQQPLIADAIHAAMHQPAGPEVKSKLA